MTPRGARVHVSASVGRFLDVQTRRNGGVMFHLPTTVAVSNYDGCPFDVVLELGADERDERLVVSRFELKARKNGAAVTAQALRAIPFGPITDLAMRYAGEVYDFDEHGGRVTGIPARRRPDAAEVKAAVRHFRGPTGSRTPKAELKNVAQAAKNAPPGGVVQAVKDLGYSEASAKRHLRDARAALLLPHTERSRPR